MKYIFLFLSFAISTIVSAQDDLNIEMISRYPTNEFTNDVWGYQHADGTEYAILGRRSGTSIISIADPTTPESISFISGHSSTWRDMKTVGNYAYVVADRGNDGLLIIDLSNLPDSTSHVFINPEIIIDERTQILNRCHNIYADEDGFLYLSGCDVSNRGVLIFDTSADPMNPTYVGLANKAYSHDVYVRDGTLFSSEILNGNLGIYDITDKTKPELLGLKRTSSSFTHNAWSSDDNSIVFTTDERANAYVDAYDISNLDEIKLLDKYRPITTQGQGVIPHNTHYMDGYLITSWYTDGVVIIDAHKPDNLVRVGQYDTFKGNHGGFDGCWGVTPYLPSGLILASDISNGLYVLRPEYKRACYLEGTASSRINGALITNAEIKILSDNPNEALTDPAGVYKTGQATSGEFKAVASHPEFFPDTATVILENGIVTTHDFLLINRASKRLTGQVTDINNNEIITNAKILIQNKSGQSRGITDANGSYFIDILEGDLNIIVGKLGYKTVLLDTSSSNSSIDIQLDKGLMDDFNFDYGWTSSGSAATGLWNRGIPKATMIDNSIANPDADVDGDIGDYAYVTGNPIENNEGVGINDVDDGNAILTSPTFDISEMNNPVLSYSAWFFNAGGNTPANDKMTISIISGEETIIIENLTADSFASIWRTTTDIAIKDLITDLTAVQLQIDISDLDPGHVVEGGFDGFSIIDNDSSTSTSDLDESLLSIQLSPNPVNGILNIKSEEIITDIQIRSVNGQIIQNLTNQNSNNISIPINSIPTGVYLVEVRLVNNQRVIKKIVNKEY